MVETKSKAVKLALAHCEAWSKHDWAASRNLLGDKVEVTTSSPQPTMPVTHTIGADEYMEGLQRFAGTVKPGSLQVHGAVGDERTALVLVTVTADFPGLGLVKISGGRSYLFDDNGRLVTEQVTFIATPA